MFGESERRESGEMVGDDDGGRRRRSRVDEVGAGLDAAHGSGGAVVGAGGFLRRVKRPEPPPLLRLRVTNLGGVAAPRPAPYSSVPHCAAAGASSGGAFPQRPLVVVVVGDGGGVCGVVVVVLLVVVVGGGGGGINGVGWFGRAG